MFGVDPYYIAWLMDKSDFYRRKINALRSTYAKKQQIMIRASLAMKIAYYQGELNLIEDELSSYAELVWTSDKVSI